MNSRERLAHWPSALLDEIAPKYEREYGAPMGWCSTLAEDIADHLAGLRAAEQAARDGCQVCGAELQQPATGRRRKYCGRPCRDRASRPASMALRESCVILANVQPLDDKYGLLFADELRRGNLPAVIEHATTSAPHHNLTLTVHLAVPSVADWALRYRVLDVARQFEDSYQVQVVCLFHEVSDLAGV